MSALERRLQILLDEARYRRVADAAQDSGRSVAAVIREAIDLRFPDDGAQARMHAAQSLLARTAETGDREGVGEDPAELKARYESSLVDQFERQ